MPESPRHRSLLVAGVSAAVVACLLLTPFLTRAGGGGGGAAADQDASMSTTSAATASVAPVTGHPQEPPACPGVDHAAALSVQDVPPGPARGAITGDRVTSSFTLEDRFTADPPPADAHPAVTAQQVLCVLATQTSDNDWHPAPGRLALADVTIHEPAGTATTTDGAGEPLRASSGRTPGYDHRLAWILVSPDVRGSSCPAMRTDQSWSPGPKAPTYEDDVYAIDAQTGGEAVEFMDSRSVCGYILPAAVMTPTSSYRSLDAALPRG